MRKISGKHTPPLSPIEDSSPIRHEKVDLKSSVDRVGERVTQIITFKGGYKKTIRGIISASIEQSEMCHMDTTDGRLILVNTPNVLMVEVFKEN